MLDVCGICEFHDLQVGFISGRGTTMAAALAHDVFDYCVNRGSPVFVCSLDAEGAFDGIPHAVPFDKVMGIIPNIFWRILVLWYKGLTVMIKWNGKISEEISVFKGTRQGGLSSPFLFNAFYQDMIKSLDDTQRGIRIGRHSYNIFCNTDDVLLASLTVSGLQRLIDTANHYICTHGLRFNLE